MKPSARAERTALARLAGAGLALALAACGARTLPLEAAPADAAPRADAGPDAVTVDAVDAPPDVAADAPADAPVDAPADVRVDAGCRGDVDCDDGVGCTRDRCDPATRACAHTPEHERCDDRLFCTGVERCDATRGCVTTPRACDDGVACTVERCDEGAARCASTPDDARCPLSHRCDAMAGCVARALAHSAGTLFEVLLPSGTVRPLAATEFTLTDIALHPDRTLYATSGRGLVRVDTTTGRVTTVAPLAASFNGLDAAPDGALYAASDTTIVRIDASTGAIATVARFPAGLGSSGDLAFLSGRLLATARDNPASNDTLLEFDLAAGTSRVVGPVGHRCVWGLAAFGPTLYGLTCNGQVLVIDAATGAGREVSRGPTQFYGASAR